MSTPANMMQDAFGRWVPKELIKPVDLLRDQTVRDLVAEARILSDCLAQARERLHQALDAFIGLSIEQYGASAGGDRGNVQLLSFDGRLKALRQVQDHITFDERLQAAKQLIDDCVREWSQGSNEKIRALVQHAFQVDKSGRINTGRVLGLRKLNIDDPRWAEAMRAIGDAVTVTSSTTYLRFYERLGDRWVPIPLDLTNAVPLPATEEP